MSLLNEDFDYIDVADIEVISVNPNINYESEEEQEVELFEVQSVERTDHAEIVEEPEVTKRPHDEDDNSNSSDTLKKERKKLKLEEYMKRRANQKVDEIKPLFDLPRRVAFELCDNIPTLPSIVFPTDPSSIQCMNQSNSKRDGLANLSFNPDLYEEIVLVSSGCNTDCSILPSAESKNGGGKTLLNDIMKENKDDQSLTSSMSLFSSIQAVVVQGSRAHNEQSRDNEKKEEHGEDKIIMHLSKNRLKPFLCSISVQTDYHPLFPPLLLSASIINKSSRNYRRKVSRSRSRSRSYSPEYNRKYSRYARSQHSTHSSSMYSSSCSEEYESDSDSTYGSSRSSSDSLKQMNNRRNFISYKRNQRADNYSDFQEERKVIYIGHLEEEITKEDLRKSFLNYGTIKKISLHAKEDG